LGQFKDSVTSVACTGHEIITGCVDGGVRVHDIRTGLCHTDHVGRPVTSVHLSNDGNCVLASCLGGVVLLIERMTGTLLKTYHGHLHDQYGLESCFTHTDAHVASASEKGVVVIWDLVEGGVVHVIEGHTKAVVGVAAHPKEAQLITSSLDGTAIFWEGTYD
jgi:mitogen-activated protein kinase organizer 1